MWYNNIKIIAINYILDDYDFYIIRIGYIMWDLYDRIIDRIPGDVYPNRIFQNGHCTILEIDGLVGATATNNQTNFRPNIVGYTENKLGYKLAPINNYQNLSWKDLANLIKSWNFREASIGAAAINAYYNNEKYLNNISSKLDNVYLNKTVDPFDDLDSICKNKIVTTVGHFGTVKKCFDNAREVRILEMNSKKGDYPDSACEYLIEDSDIIIITGFTFINKTLPRLLELSSSAHVIFVGPSCPIAADLFDLGVNDIASSLFSDFDNVKQRARERTHKILVKVGKEVRISHRNEA